jgi:hypothetical protein
MGSDFVLAETGYTKLPAVRSRQIELRTSELKVL